MKKPKKIYASKKADWKRKNAAVKDIFGGWADFRPRRDVGVYANERTTYKHNGETRMA